MSLELRVEIITLCAVLDALNCETLYIHDVYTEPKRYN